MYIVGVRARARACVRAFENAGSSVYPQIVAR